MLGGLHSGRETARRALIMAIAIAIVFVPAVVALAMLLTGNAG
jgi:hypothetical protein